MKTLYKYMTAKRALTCLPEVGDGTLRATQPAALNDPFECAVRTLFIDFGWDELRRNQEFADALSSIPGTTPVTGGDVARAKEQYGSLYLRDLMTKQLSQRFGIVSFAIDPRHPLLWSHYTLDGSGFVVGYDVERLKVLSRHEECLRPVRYTEEIVAIESYDLLEVHKGALNAVLSLKSDHWTYENEWRLIVELNETIGTGLEDHHGLPINLLRVPNEAVVSVYYTERTPVKVVDLLRSRLENPNNKYRTKQLTKLIASSERYGYEDSLE
jgi:hypothetical protein